MNGMSGICRVACVGMIFGACVPALRGNGDTRPRLIAIAPDSVRIIPGNVTEVDLRGSGFDTSRIAPGNTVRIGLMLLREVRSSAGGTLIRVAIPPAIPGAGESPPAPWMSGRYAVTVSTNAGTSDTLQLVIAMSGRRP